MGNNIRYSKEALRDLDDIWDHIAQELQNPSAAKRVVDRIMDAVDQLKTFPLMGSPLAAVTVESGDHRFLVSGSYMIFYRPHGSDVYVDRVLYGRRDYLRILFGDISGEEP